MTGTLFDLAPSVPPSHHAAPIVWPDWPFDGLLPGAYGLIWADPPWAYRMRGAGGYEKSPQAHYDCVDLDDLARLPVAKLAAPDCVLWLWTTWPHLASGQALRLVESWGFVGKTGLPWIKRTAHGKLAFGTGYMFRGCTEPVIVATRGAPSFDRSFTAKTRGLIDELAREHSRKPEAAFDVAKRLVPTARRCELFARAKRPGWDGWGNETEKFKSAAGGVSLPGGESGAVGLPATDAPSPGASANGPVGESGRASPAEPDSPPAFSAPRPPPAPSHSNGPGAARKDDVFIDREALLEIPAFLRRQKVPA